MTEVANNLGDVARWYNDVVNPRLSDAPVAGDWQTMDGYMLLSWADRRLLAAVADGFLTGAVVRFKGQAMEGSLHEARWRLHTSILLGECEWVMGQIGDMSSCLHVMMAVWSRYGVEGYGDWAGAVRREGTQRAAETVRDCLADARDLYRRRGDIGVEIQF
jgi:hypothetical protein